MISQQNSSPPRPLSWKLPTPHGTTLLWTALAVVALLCLLVVRPRTGNSPFQAQSVLAYPVWLLDSLSPKLTCDNSASLEQVVDQAAMADGTVILSSFTMAVSPMLDLFLHRIRQQPATRRLLRHTVILVFDPEGYQYCCQQGLRCFYRDPGGGGDGGEQSKERGHHSKYFSSIMWARMETVLQVLKSGHHVLVTDLDILWFKDPLPYFRNSTDWDIAFTVDIWNGWDPSLCRANCGFFLARSTPGTISFVEFWIADHDTKHPEFNEQMVLNLLLPRGASSAVPVKKLRVAYLHPDNFGSKCVRPQRVEETVIFHATCCGKPAPVKIAMLENVEAMYERQMGLRELEEGEELNGNFGWNFGGC